MTNQEQYELIWEKAKKYDRLVEVLDKIRAEIEQKCDRINSIASVLPYTAHREIQELLCEIMDLPSVEQEPKTGHWIDHQAGRWIYAKCSECETVHDTQTNFCPNCGCAMKGESE